MFSELSNIGFIPSIKSSYSYDWWKVVKAIFPSFLYLSNLFFIAVYPSSVLASFITSSSFLSDSHIATAYIIELYVFPVPGGPYKIIFLLPSCSLISSL